MTSTKAKGLRCPFCDSRNMVANGTANNVFSGKKEPKFLCKHCKKQTVRPIVELVNV